MRLLKKEAKPEENKGFAFVAFKTRDAAARAVAELPQSELKDRKARGDVTIMSMVPIAVIHISIVRYHHILSC